MTTNIVRSAYRRTMAIRGASLALVLLAAVMISFGPGWPLVREAKAFKPAYAVCVYSNNTCENCSYSSPPVTTWCYNISDQYWGECDPDQVESPTPCTQNSSPCNDLYSCATPPVQLRDRLRRRWGYLRILLQLIAGAERASVWRVP